MVLSGAGAGATGGASGSGVVGGRTEVGGGSPITMPDGVPGTADPPPLGCMTTELGGAMTGGIVGGAGGPVMMVVPESGGDHWTGGDPTGAYVEAPSL